MSNIDLETVEEKLRLAIRQNQQAERLAGLGFWEWDDVADRLSYCSAGYARLLDLSHKELMDYGDNPDQDQHFVHPDDRERYIKAEEQAYLSGSGINIEYRILTPAGRVRHVHEIGEVVKNDAGEVIRTSGILQDITQSKLLQEEMARVLADGQRAERLAQLGTYTWNWAENKLESCSAEYARLHEMTIEQAREKFTSEAADYAFIHPDDRDAVAAAETAALARGEGYTIEYRMLLPSGHIRHIREVCELERDDEGVIVRTLGSIQDITARR